jgi:molecular chaperone HtpG
MSAPETHEFKAEVAALLRLVTNSLYTNREIFLRELISNAADALDKARFEALVNPELSDRDQEPTIRLITDAERGVLIIEDNGIGMSREEVSQNLGTIAHSGTLAFLEQAKKANDEGEKPDLNLIGQFGVGFYSAFMVASQIDVYSRSARPGHDPVHWQSKGDGSYTILPTTKEGRGTRIELTLQDDAKEFVEALRLETLVKRYSDYVMHPITIRELAGDADSEARQLNQASALWAKQSKDVTDEDYAEFYKHVMGGFVLPGDEPTARLHISLDAPIQFQALLFVPGRAPADLFMEDRKALQLFARRVLVIESCDKLLPTYLRFFRGVVDSEDLPLNVSREMLQEHQSLSAIRRQLTRKAISLLEGEAKNNPEGYDKIWDEFGSVLKEGIHTDNAQQKKLQELLRYRTTGSEEATVSLAKYVEDMPEGQPAIYYITGESEAALRSSPHVEACTSRGYQVLLMTDAVDEWVVQDLSEYEGKALQSVTRGDLDLDPKAEDDSTEKSEEEKPAETPDSAIQPTLERARTLLAEHVSDVKESRRLTDSAACLVDSADGIGKNMERILRMANRTAPKVQRILELNASHAFVRAIDRVIRETPDSPKVDAWIQILLDQANLAEGEVPDPAGTVKRIQAVLDQLAGGDASSD